MNINIERTKAPKQKPSSDNLGFGNYFSDHMFIMDYTHGKGWHDARIVPYGNFEMSPANMALHYGQSVFEGLKAYKTKDGRILLFRPEKNMERLNITNDRMCIPSFDSDLILDAIEKLVNIDKDWIPEGEGTALYIRPFIFANDPFLGVRPALTYKFMIILCPVGAYYPEGVNPIKIYVEPKYVRAVRGGVGCAKTSGNYAASLKAQKEAKEKQYTQVLWLDGIERKYVEEVGTMNVFFKIGDQVVTPELSGSILPGITRASTIELLKHWGIDVVERKISIQEVFEANASGLLKEVFGTGTAAVISPVGELNWDGNIITVNKGKTGELSQRIYDEITGIQNGVIEDRFGWTVEL